jgi:hypothetical protein
MIRMVRPSGRLSDGSTEPLGPLHKAKILVTRPALLRC